MGAHLKCFGEALLMSFTCFWRNEKTSKFLAEKSALSRPMKILSVNTWSSIIIPHHTIVAGYYGFTLDVRVSAYPSVSRTFICPSVRFSFPDDNLSKHQWIFTKLGLCIVIVEIWFGIANGKISSKFYGVICPRHFHIFVSG